MTTDKRLHFLGGFFLGLRSAFKSQPLRVAALRTIYLYGWQREVAQHDADLNEHQIAEARAWGLGAAKALRLAPWPAPSPPYPA